MGYSSLIGGYKEEEEGVLISNLLTLACVCILCSLKTSLSFSFLKDNLFLVVLYAFVALRTDSEI